MYLILKMSSPFFFNYLCYMRRNSFSAECGVLALFCIKFCNNIKTEEAIEIVN